MRAFGSNAKGDVANRGRRNAPARAISELSAAGLLAATVFAQAASASGASGTVDEIWSSPTSTYVLFSLAGTGINYHRCNTSGRFSIDMRAPGGNSTLQLLLSAKDEGYTVSVRSLNTCNEFNAENIRELTIR